MDPLLVSLRHIPTQNLDKLPLPPSRDAKLSALMLKEGPLNPEAHQMYTGRQPASNLPFSWPIKTEFVPNLPESHFELIRSQYASFSFFVDWSVKMVHRLDQRVIILFTLSNFMFLLSNPSQVCKFDAMVTFYGSLNVYTFWLTRYKKMKFIYAPNFLINWYFPKISVCLVFLEFIF